MKQFLKKPLKLAIAATLAIGGVAATSCVSAGVNSNADALGDMALVPYYTVKGNFVTGIQVVNTSNKTQAVKIRLRRDVDSADVLDFNLIMSPFDVWSGYVSKSGSNIVFNTTDKTCTAPYIPTGRFISPTSASIGADEGYIEVIGMGQTDNLYNNGNNIGTGINGVLTNTGNPIAAQVKHASGLTTTAGCKSAERNFLKANVLNNAQTQESSASTINDWEDTENVLKVSYFIRDAVTGMEMGDNATHIVDFSDDAMMTNQQAAKGLANGFADGFDFPDLDGGGANDSGVAFVGNEGNAADRGTIDGVYNNVIRRELGAESIINNWSYNPGNNVSTDWIVTIPGQYLMVDPAVAANVRTDLPLEATLTLYDREETETSPGTVVVSPGIPGGKTSFPNEVNVVEWGGKSVYASDNAIQIDPASSGITQPFGWASLALVSKTRTGVDQVVFDLTNTGASCMNTTTGVITAAANCLDVSVGADAAAVALGLGAVAGEIVENAPVLGFSGWQRKFAAEENKNYGRIIGHSRR